jgi:mucin-19
MAESTLTEKVQVTCAISSSASITSSVSVATAVSTGIISTGIFGGPPPLVIQQAATGWFASNTPTAVNAVLANPPTPGNLLIAIYGGLIGAVANLVAPPTGFTQLNDLTQLNPMASNMIGLGIETRVVQPGDGQTWGFTMPQVIHGSATYGVGAVILEVSNAGVISMVLTSGVALPIGPVSMSSSLNALMLGATAMFTGMTNGAGWSAGVGWNQLSVQGSSSIYAGLGVYDIPATGGSMTSDVTNSAVNPSNENFVSAIVNIASVVPSLTVAVGLSTGMTGASVVQGGTATESVALSAPITASSAVTAATTQSSAISASISGSSGVTAVVTESVAISTSSTATSSMVGGTTTMNISLTAPITTTSVMTGFAPPNIFDTTMASYSPVWWAKLNETTGTAVADYGSGANATGLLNGPATLGQVGPILSNPSETSFLFTGSGTSCVTFQDAADLDFGTGSFTFGIYLQYTGKASSHPLYKGGAGQAGFDIAVIAGLAHVRIQDSVAQVDISSLPTINDGKLHLIVGVVDRTANLLRMYIDGVQKATGSIAATGSVSNAALPLTIGGTSATVGDFPGAESQGFLIGSALTAAQIMALVQAANAVVTETVALSAAVSCSAIVGVNARESTAVNAAVTSTSSMAAVENTTINETAAIAATSAVAANSLTGIKPLSVNISSSVAVAANNAEKIALSTPITCSSVVGGSVTHKAAITAPITASAVVAAGITHLIPITVAISSSAILTATPRHVGNLSTSISSNAAMFGGEFTLVFSGVRAGTVGTNDTIRYLVTSNDSLRFTVGADDTLRYSLTVSDALRYSVAGSDELRYSLTSGD